MASDQNSGDVLVVEDDSALNELVGAYVQLAGFEYRAALDGSSALALARASIPRLILLDIMLPDIDGFEVCRQLKLEHLTRGVPVLMLTALTQEESRRKGTECGAVQYMTKPFEPNELMAAIQRHAKKKR